MTQDTVKLTTPADGTPLAIIGIGCLFPKAGDCSSYWANIREGIELFPEALLVGNLTPQPDTWYSMLLAVDEGAEMLVLIWNPERPETRIRYFGNYKEGWENLPWHFAVSLNKGSVYIDNVRKFTFTDIKLP